MAKNLRRTLVTNVTSNVLYPSQLQRFIWQERPGARGSFWEVKVGDTILRTNDSQVIEVESNGGLDDITVFVTSWQIVEGKWPGPVSDPESLEVNQYLHVRWPNQEDPEATHQVLLFETGVVFRSFAEIYAQE